MKEFNWDKEMQDTRITVDKIKKKEFEEKFCFKDNEGQPHNIWWSGITPEVVWQWIEQQIKDAKLEPERLLKAALACNNNDKDERGVCCQCREAINNYFEGELK